MEYFSCDNFELLGYKTPEAAQSGGNGYAVSMILTGVARAPIVAKKELKGSDGKLIKVYNYDRYHQWDISGIPVITSEGSTDSLLAMEDYYWSLIEQHPTRDVRFTALADPESFSNTFAQEDYQTISLKFTVRNDTDLNDRAY